MENNIIVFAAIMVGILFPAYVIVFGDKTRQLLIDNPSKKLFVFRQTALNLIVLSVLVLIPTWMGVGNLDEMGLSFISHPIWGISLFAIPFGAIWILRMIKLTTEQADKAMTQYDRLLFLLPTTKPELKMMQFVSFVAGICEELIYRGFLLWFLSTHLELNIVLAIILANVPFALAHLTTTGWRNTIGTFVLALIFTVAFLITGSLWLSMLLHILVDLYSATLSYKAHTSCSENLNVTESPV